jgi:hypothetical protein
MGTNRNAIPGMDFIEGIEISLTGITFSVDYLRKLNQNGRTPR